MVCDINKRFGITLLYIKETLNNIQLAVFDTADEATKFAEFIGTATVHEIADCFLVSTFGSYVGPGAWQGQLLEAKKRFNLKYRIQ